MIFLLIYGRIVKYMLKTLIFFLPLFIGNTTLCAGMSAAIVQLYSVKVYNNLNHVTFFYREMT